MDASEVSARAKFVAFPSANRGLSARYFSDDSHEWTLLPDTHDVYEGSVMNKHHYTTKYHREHVLPALNGLFGFGFDAKDFRLQENKVPDGHDPSLVLDLSYLVPLDDKKFKVLPLEYEMRYESRFSGLLNNERTANITWRTPYHDLFCFPHTSTTVRNLSGGNGRSILILGDSQMIPSLSTLCCYYGTVTYVDNRNGKHISDRLDDRYDDILVSVYERNVDYYIGFLA